MRLINETKEWKSLEKHSEEMKKLKMRDLFEADSNRFGNFSIRLNDMLFDYSKNIINDETIALLVSLAERASLKQKIDDMFSGVKINTIEGRAVLHTALRNAGNKPIKVDGNDVMPAIDTVKRHIRMFVESVRSGKWRGVSGKPITDIVNIGIGGSDLGPAMVAEALSAYSNGKLRVHFVSNVDPTDIQHVLKSLFPDQTLFVIASKTFTTQETLANAHYAKNWFIKNFARNIKDMANHFVALSTNEKACVEFGISPRNMFQFWDWVGGRYSLWSAIGLSIALYIGYDNFEQLLLGAYDADLHFRETPFERNIPILMGILGLWYNNFFGAASHCVVAYDQHLRRFTEFLQQLDMESLGKSITLDGKEVHHSTGQIIWGTIGTNAQHSFFQLIHQGTRLIPTDFIATVLGHNDSNEQRAILLSNFFAQTEALMRGKTKDEVLLELRDTIKDEQEIARLLPHKVFDGNKPTNSILLNKLTPQTIGKLIAFYEHKVFVQGAIWNINPFDQWGVELGKQLAKRILPELAGTSTVNTHDSSTNGLINYYKRIIDLNN